MKPSLKNGKKLAMLAALLLFTAVTSIDAPKNEYLSLQHLPTILALLLLVWIDSKWPLDIPSYAGALVVLAFHVFGARYLYSYVPYDAWCRDWFGFSPNEQFGWKRNHYDRLVHLVYGLVMGFVLSRWLRRNFPLSGGVSALIAFQIILSTSLTYELVEWLIAEIMAPDWAESFNGQQGDVWDAHKDTALAFGGGAVSCGLSALLSSRRKPVE